MKTRALPGTLLGFDPALLFDLVVRVTLGIFFAFTAGIYYRNTIALLHPSGTVGLLPDGISFMQAFGVLAGGIYTMMIASLYVLRHRPINSFVGFWPSLAAVAGGFLMFGLVWFKPRLDLDPAAQLFASGLVLIGNCFCAYVLTQLGRSFSILPEGRKLVTVGPYKYIRHPLYVAEMIATLGTMILYLSWGTVALVATQTLLQLVRIHYEERVLTATFPAYKTYAAKTARLIPGVY